MSKIIQVNYTEEEKEKIIQIENLDYKIKNLDREYGKEKRKKEPDEAKLNQYEKECKFYLKKRNQLVREVYVW